VNNLKGKDSESFFTATFKQIRGGEHTDCYFQRTLQILKAKGINKRVVAEVFAKELPCGWSWGVLGGVQEVVRLFKGFPLIIKGLKEGTFFSPRQPVLSIEGNYTDFGLYETALLGLLCQSSGITAAAARCRKAAGDRILLSFGARRMHPTISPMIERGAFIGGCDGVSEALSAQMIGEKPQGTMPHALILVMGDTVEATRAFHQVIARDIKRISLIDTFNDEKFESLRVAGSLGKELYGLRFDTPSSRRGNLVEILREVRWELNLRGYADVKLFVSGGVDEKSILELNSLADGYGVGTFISNAPVVNFSLDIVEIEGEPLAKRGKESGRKKLVRCPQCYTSKVLAEREPEGNCPCGGKFEHLTQPLIEGGELVYPLASPQELRRYVLEQLSHYEL